MNTNTISIVDEFECIKRGSMDVFSHPEYVCCLNEVQTSLARWMNPGDEEYDQIQMDELIADVKKTARHKDLSSNSIVHKGIRNMEDLRRELAGNIAGKNSEDRVGEALDSVSREYCKVFKNTALTGKDGEKTEVDFLVLTESGILLLEVKSTSEDVIFTKDGRMFKKSGISFGSRSIMDCMELKKKLLTEMISKSLEEHGYSVPIKLESYIVLSVSKPDIITYRDYSKKEKICFNYQLTEIVNEYSGKGDYTPGQLAKIEEVLIGIDANKQLFKFPFDLAASLDAITEALKIVYPERFIEPVVKEPVKPAKHSYLGIASGLVSAASFAIMTIGIATSTAAYLTRK